MIVKPTFDAFEKQFLNISRFIGNKGGILIYEVVHS